MSMNRTLATIAVVPIALSLGVFACGGKIADDGPSDAAVTPGSGDGATPSPTGGGGSGGGTASPTTEPTPSGTGTSPTSPTVLTLDVTSCGARPDTCSADPGYATEMVDRWLARIVDACEHPTTGVPPAFPACGTMYVKFHRPDGAGCVQTVKFSAPQTPAFAACIATALSNQRCAAGLFLTDPGDFDSRTFDLCAPH
jgi:hypothetical protein